MPTNSAFMVTAIESITSDFIACNSGTCTGSFSANSLAANDCAITGQITANQVQANFGTFLSGLTVSGLPVCVDCDGGINALVEDANPTLSANLNANSNSVVNLDSIIGNSAAFALSVSSDSLIGNSLSIAGAASASSLDANSAAITGNVGADSVSVNSGSFAIGITSGSINANNGSFASSLTISGIPVAKANVPPMRLYLSLRPLTINNMPSALNLLDNVATGVQLANLTNMNEVRFLATQTAAGSTNARMRLNFANSFQTTAAGYGEVLSVAGPNGGVELNISTANSVKDSGWLPLRNAAKGNVHLAVVISGGDGMADPQFGAVLVEFR